MNSTNKIKSCLNCGAETESSFCPACGQRSSVERLTIKTLLAEIQDKLIGLDSRFGRTFKDLCFKPGEVARSYIRGNRVKYVGPAAYFFIQITVLVLVISLLDIDMVAYTQQANSAVSGTSMTEDQIRTQQFLQNWVFDNFKFAIFLFIPFYVLTALILFRKSGYNMLEHSVFIFYTQAHTQVVNIISLCVFKLTGISFSFMVTLVSVLYMSFFAMDFYKHNKKIVAFLKGLLIFPLGLVFLLLFIFIASVVMIVLFPDFRNIF